MGKQKAKVLFFINGPVPTVEEREEADTFTAAGHRVAFRNARFVIGDEAPEDFDVVAGNVPPLYAKAAAEKPQDDGTEPPKVDPAAVPAESPLAPPAGAGAAPKPPKADPAKGWKPNA